MERPYEPAVAANQGARGMVWRPAKSQSCSPAKKPPRRHLPARLTRYMRAMATCLISLLVWTLPLQTAYPVVTHPWSTVANQTSAALHILPEDGYYDFRFLCNRPTASRQWAHISAASDDHIVERSYQNPAGRSGESQQQGKMIGTFKRCMHLSLRPFEISYKPSPPYRCCIEVRSLWPGTPWGSILPLALGTGSVRAIQYAPRPRAAHHNGN
jgi:hypothetical protein